MPQRGQVFDLKSNGTVGAAWAYRYRIGSRASKRVQRGGFPSKLAAEQALERALERLREEKGLVETPTLSKSLRCTSPSTTPSRDDRQAPLAAE
jgi:hypothetical protein